MTTLTERVQKFARENGISGFDRVRIGRGSKKPLNYPGAVAYAERDGGFLQSVREAVVVRVASGSADCSDAWQHTSDFALYFRQDGVNSVAFVDGYDFVDNRNRSLISRCQEGFDAHSANPSREWCLPFDDVVSYFSRLDGRVSSVLLPGHFYVDGNDLGDDADARKVWCDIQAERGRVFVVPETKLVLPTTKPKEGVYFGNHPIVKDLMGEDVVRVFSDYLLKQSYKGGSVWFPDKGSLSSVPEGSALCRLVGLDYVGFGNIFYAGKQFNDYGRARGLVHVEETAELETKK